MTKANLTLRYKYRKGAKILSVTEFVLLVISGDMFYEIDKVQNSGWAANWSITMIARRVARGHLFYAERDLDHA